MTWEKKANLEQRGSSSWLNGKLSYRSATISRDNAPGESRAGEEPATAKGWLQEAGFCFFMKPAWFSLQLEVVKESNQTSHFFPNKPTLIYSVRNEDKADQHGNFSVNRPVPMKSSNQAERERCYRPLWFERDVYTITCKTSASHRP